MRRALLIALPLLAACHGTSAAPSDEPDATSGTPGPGPDDERADGGTTVADAGLAPGAWSPAVRIDHAGLEPAALPEIASDAAGNVTVIWPEGGDIHAARYERAAGWGTTVQIDTADVVADAPDLAVASDGGVLALWTSSSNIASRRFRDGAWGEILVVDPEATGDASMPDVAYAGNGDAMAVWARWADHGYEVWASRFDGAWDAPLMLADASGELSSPHAPVVAGDAAGNFATLFDRGTSPVAWSSLYVAGAGWSGTAQVPLAQDAWVSSGELGVDHGGALTAAWARIVDDGDVVVESVRRVNGAWTQDRLDLADGEGEYAAGVQVAVAPSGEAVVVWHQSDGTGPRNAELWSSRFVPGAGWTAPVRLSDPAYNVWASDVAIGADGRAAAVWTEETTHDPRVHGAVQDPGGEWSTGERLSKPDTRAGQPAVTIDGTGAVTAVFWQRYAGAEPSTIWAARFE